MSDTIIRDIEQSQLNSDLPELCVGDTVDVHLRIIEGAKERIQVFTGVIIAMSGAGINRTITVRRIVANEGVERVIPLHSPRVAKVEVKRHGHVRRSKLYYLRERVGKKRRLRDRRRGLGSLLQKEPKPEEKAEVQAELDEPAADAAEAASEEKQEA